MFKVDRKSAEARSFEKPGIYQVEITSVEPAISAKGDSMVKLVLRSHDGCVASDTILNRDSTHWRINQLIAACPSISVSEGAELDFNKREVFNQFMAQFKGLSVQVKIEEESYQKDGETKKAFRVRKYSKATDADQPF